MVMIAAHPMTTSAFFAIPFPFPSVGRRSYIARRIPVNGLDTVLDAPSPGQCQPRTNDPTERRGRPCAPTGGCGRPEDRLGDDRNILWSEIVASAEANDITPAEAVRNIQAMAEQMGAN
jgi:hypothetical protein